METALRRARQRKSWTKSRLIHELTRRAQARDLTLPSAESLSRMIAAWENGQRGPSEMYRRLLCDVYGDSGVALGLEPEEVQPPREASRQLAAIVLAARYVDIGAVTELQKRTDQLRLQDRRFGAPTVLDQLQAHVSTVQQLLTHALLPGTRAPLAAVLADAATLAGWQALDNGRTEQ